jgi:predicted metal-dependent peptidase
MENLEKLAAERVQKARAAVIASRPFYGCLVANVVPIMSRSVKTAGTDSKHHYWNPDFVMSLPQAEIEGTQVHESEHDARHHSTRRGARDPKEWNAACDLALDQDILGEGFKLPATHMVWLSENWKPNYKGMSAEDIYRCRELDRANREKEQQDQQQPVQGQPENKPGQSEQESGDGDAEADNESGDDQSGADDASEQSKPGDEPDEEAEGHADGEQAEREADAEAGNGDGDHDEGDKPSDGDGASAGDQPGDQDSDAGQAEPPKGGNDAGQCGEVLDAAPDAAEIAEQDAKWDVITRQAVSLAKARGDLPGYMTREIERMNAGKQDWRETLRAWFDQGALVSQTWNRPNRRFAGQGLILPGNQRDGINKGVFLVDTSASCDAKALQCVNEEAQAALDDGVLDQVVVVYGDTRVTRVDEYHAGDEIEFDPKGGGGTRMRPLFNWVEENAPDASLVVCFTDMEFEDLEHNGPEPSMPVLFAAHGYPDKVRGYLANAPWGAPGLDVGAH